MPPLEQVLAARIRELRTARGWSQAQLADRARRMGLRWSAGAVGLIETGGQRADRLIDVAALCWIFDVSVEDLLAGDDEVSLPNGETVGLPTVRNALSGQVRADVRHPPQTTRHGADDPEELARIGAKLGLGASELRAASFAVFGNTRFSQVRDERAEITEDTPRRTAQARRGHATRALLAEIDAAFAAEGRDLVLKRGAVEARRQVDEVMARLGHTIAQQHLEER